MEAVWAFIGLAVGLIIAGTVVYFLLNARLKDFQARISELQSTQSRVQSDLDAAEKAAAEHASEARRIEAILNERESAYEDKFKALEHTHEEKLAAYREAEDQFRETFKALSADALKLNSETLIQQAEEVLKRYKETAEGDLDKKRVEIENLLQPMKETLVKLDEQNQGMEQKRSRAYGELAEQLKSLMEHQGMLKSETDRLVRALQDPGSVGSWGEMVLERCLEMAGLEEKWSYASQETMDHDGERQRPDVVVKLPGGKILIIDSKAPLGGYLEAVKLESKKEQEPLLRAFSTKVLDHAKVLGKRDYSKRSDTPDFTIMFIPSEAAFRAAMETRPMLTEEVMSQRVVLATPSTLFALLQAVAFGWQQEKLAVSAQEVQKHGQELYERLFTLMEHYNKLGSHLKNACEKYNDFTSSLESRVLPSARKMKELGLQTTKTIDRASTVDSIPRLAVVEKGQGALPQPELETN